MKRIIALVVIALSATWCVSGKKIKTTRPRLTASPVTAADTVPVVITGNIVVCDTALSLHGFDKPLQSSFESVLATNNTDKTVSTVFLTIEYLDRKQRQLHKRQCRIPTDIPPGETRLLRFASWDRQNSFYYEKSRRPRVEATRFSVICTVDSIETD